MQSYRQLIERTRLLEKDRNISLNFTDKKIVDSWIRCFENGLSPERNSIESVISASKLNELQDEYNDIRGFILPELELLHSQIAGTNFMVAFANNEGVVLDTLYDNEFYNSKARKVVIPGSVWKEEYRGTNGLGLTLKTKSASIVAGGEHFFNEHCHLSCFASPIFDHNQNIVGIIDASTDTSSRQDHTLALVKLSAKSVEQKLFLNSFQHTNIYSFHPRSEYLNTNSIGLIAVNDDGEIEGVNSNARVMLSGIFKDTTNDFFNIFTTPYHKIAYDLNLDKVLKVKDWLGSSLFIKLFQRQVSNHNRVNNNLKQPYKPCVNCEGSAIKEKQCILIQKTYKQTGEKVSSVSRTLNISRTTVYKHLS